MKVFLNVVNKVIGKIYLIFAILLVMFAILVSLARALTPVFKYYQSDFTSWAESLLHKPIHIEKVDTQWRNFQPVLDLHNVTIFNKVNGKSIFKIQDLQVGLNIIESILKRRIIVSRLYIDGMHMSLVQNANKAWRVKGFDNTIDVTKNGSIKLKDTISWLLSQPVLMVQKVSLNIHAYHHKVQKITDLNMILKNSADKHYLRGQANLLKHGSPLDVAINLQGSAENVSHLNGTFYLRGAKTPISSWIGSDKFYGFSCEQGDFSFQLWGKWQNNKINDIQSNINFSNVILQTLKSQKNLYIDHLSANLFWGESNSNQWLLSADNVNLNINHHQWPKDKFSLSNSSSSTTDLNGGSQNFQLQYLRLQDLKTIVPQLEFLSDKIRKFWQALSPRGDISDLQLIHYGNIKNSKNYHFLFNFHKLAISAYKDIPGFSGFDGTLNLMDKKGQLKLDTKSSTLNYEKLFRQQFLLQNLSGSLQWENGSKGLQLQAQNIAVSTSDLKTLTNVNFLFPANKSSPIISLLAKFSDTKPGDIKQYYPVKIMPVKLIEWLDQAFVSGQSVSGSFILHGGVHQFPFLMNNGQFIVDSDVKNLNFNYKKAWPQIKNLSGNLIFAKNEMNFIATGGSIEQQPITQLSAVIPNLAAHPQAHLYIDSHANIESMVSGKHFVLKSPIQKKVGSSLAPLNIHGSGRLHLNLIIPLKHGEVTTKGEITLLANELLIPDWNLQFSDLNGVIRFSNHSLTARKLSARLFGEPVSAMIKTLNLNKRRTTQIDVKSRVDLTNVKKYFNLNKINFITGVAPFRAILNINNLRSHLIFTSAMQGIKLNLPKPFFKPAKTKQSLQVDAFFNKNKAPIVRVTYRPLLGAVLAYSRISNKVVFSRAIVNLGKGGYTLQSTPGINVTGKLANFSWAKWSNVLHSFFKDSTKNMKNKSFVLQQVKVSIGMLQAFKQTLENVEITVKNQTKSWIFNIVSKKINGTVDIPVNYKTQSTTGEFKTLMLQAFTTNKNENVGQWDPRNIIPINITAYNFTYAGREYGQVLFNANPLPNGMNITKLSVVNKDYILNTKGQWLRINKQDQSSFSGSLYTDNLGKLLKQENFTDHLDKGSGTAKFSLTWPDAPSEFQTKNLKGVLNLNFSNGTIVGLSGDANTKLGLGKLINILSLQSIAKRLTLNFNDLNESGYDFSTLRGDLTLNGGNLYTQNLYLDGSVAELYLKGELGLQKQLYDINLRVNPYLTSSLPIIATLVGGPLAGIATWAISKVARIGIEKAVVYRYHIGGTWNDPVIKKINS